MLNIKLNQAGTFRIEFLNFNDSPFTAPYINTQTLVTVGADNLVSAVVPNGNYTIPKVKITKVSDTTCVVTLVNVGINCVVLPSCGCNPTSPFRIEGLTKNSNTSISINFNGCNVHFATAQLKRVSDNSVAQTFSNFPVTSSNITLTIVQPPDGQYYFTLIGNDCTGSADSPIFTVETGGGGNPEPETGKEFYFAVNATGNGFDFGRPDNNYISDNQIQLITDSLTGLNKDAVDVIRMPFIWGQYNPSEGVYKDVEMTTAINWIKSLRPFNPPKIDLLIVPILEGGDTRIPTDEIHVDNNGNGQDCTYPSNIPSYFGTVTKGLITVMLDHLITRLVTVHQNDIRVIEYAAGQSEEHYMPYTANTSACPGCCGSVFSGIGDYSIASRNAWRLFLSSKYGNGNLPYLINGVQYNAANAMLPNVGVTSVNNDNMNYSQPAYRDLFRFYSKGIFDTWKNFHDRVKALSNFKTGYVVPDLINEQAVKWIFHGGTIFLGMKYADQFYHTHNITVDEWQANLWGTDVILGTFPNMGKLSAIEFDPTDTNAIYTGSINTTHVFNVILRFFKNGGKVVHAAQGWTTAQMNQWKQLIADFKINYVNNPSFVLEDRSVYPTVNIDTNQIFTNYAVYKQAWESVGGNHQQSAAAYNATPVNLYILNNGTLDNFWLEGLPSNPNPPNPSVDTILKTYKINIEKSSGTYSDTIPNTEGNFVAYYYLNGKAFEGASGERLAFINVALPPNHIVTVEKIFVNPSYFPDWNTLKTQQNKAAYAGGHPEAIYKYEQHIFKTV